MQSVPNVDSPGRQNGTSVCQFFHLSWSEYRVPSRSGFVNYFMRSMCDRTVNLKKQKTTTTFKPKFTLKYVPRKTFEPKNVSAQERKRIYEEARPERIFNRNHQAKRPWLKIDSITCAICIEHYGINVNVS